MRMQSMDSQELVMFQDPWKKKVWRWSYYSWQWCILLSFEGKPQPLYNEIELPQGELPSLSSLFVKSFLGFRVQRERERSIDLFFQSLNHPFLPPPYTHFQRSKSSLNFSYGILFKMVSFAHKDTNYSSLGKHLFQLEAKVN